MMQGIKGNEVAEMLILAEFIYEQPTNLTFPAAFVSVAKPNSQFNVKSDGLLVRASAVDGASQQFVRTILPTRFSTFTVLFF